MIMKSPSLNYQVGWNKYGIKTQHILCMHTLLYNVRGWSEKYSALTIDGNTISKVSFSKLIHLS